MNFEKHFKNNLETLKENHYEIHSALISFLNKNKSFDRDKFSLILKLPAEFYDPQKVSKQKFIIDLPSVCWLGLVLGNKISQHILDGDSQKSHIMIEPSMEVFCFFLMLPQVETLLKRKNIFWIIAAPIEKLSSHYSRISKSKLIVDLSTRRSNIIKLPRYQEEYFDKAVELWNSFIAVTASSTCISPMDEYFGFHNSTLNTPALLKAPLIQSFKNKFKGTPGIVISTGPSLNHTLPFLKNLENKAVIYCADSGYRMVREQGVTPHFVGCFERTGLTKRFFENLQTDPSYLIATSVVYKNSIEAFQNRLIHFLRPHFGMKYFFPNIPTSMVTMSSVAHLGLYSLWLMGCSPIYLVGQDLAFDPETKLAHASGHPFTKDEQPWVGIKAENHRGEIVETDFLWLEFSYTLAEIIRRYHIDCFNVIPEKYGIKINNTKRLEPNKEVFDFSESRQDIFQTIHEICNQNLQTSQIQKSFVSKVDELIIEIKNQIPIAAQVLREIILFSEKIPKNQTNEQEQQYLLFRKEIEDRVKHISKPSFLTSFLFGKNLDIAKNMQLVPITGTSTTAQWNYTSFLSTIIGQQIATFQLLLKDLKHMKTL